MYKGSLLWYFTSVWCLQLCGPDSPSGCPCSTVSFSSAVFPPLVHLPVSFLQVPFFFFILNFLKHNKTNCIVTQLDITRYIMHSLSTVESRTRYRIFWAIELQHWSYEKPTMYYPFAEIMNIPKAVCSLMKIHLSPKSSWAGQHLFPGCIT